LPRLLDADPPIQIRAISELEPVCHQNSFYEATLPVALYVAAILAHPATATVGPGRRADSERDCPVRAALLDWLGSLAYDADDERLATEVEPVMSATVLLWPSPTSRGGRWVCVSGPVRDGRRPGGRRSGGR
jgi:hypothetical protein